MTSKPQIQLDNIIARNEAMLTADLLDEMVMMNIDKGEYYGLNLTSSHIWNLLENAISVSGICEALLKKFEIDPATCQQDVLQVLDEMVELGVVEIRN